MSTDKAERQLDQFWIRHDEVKARLDSLIEAKGGVDGEHDKYSDKGQLQLALTWLAFCRVALALDDLPGAYDLLFRAEAIHDTVLKLHFQPDIITASNTSTAQSSRASKLRRDPVVADIINRLARRDQTAKELWPEFIGSLDAAGLDPIEGQKGKNRDPAVWYETASRRTSIAIGRFRNLLGEERKKITR